MATTTMRIVRGQEVKLNTSHILDKNFINTMIFIKSKVRLKTTFHHSIGWKNNKTRRKRIL